MMGVLRRIRSAFSVLMGGVSRGWIPLGGSALESTINESNAITVATYYACIRNIGEDIAKLPIRLIKNEGKKRIAIDDDFVKVISVNPNPNCTAFTFWSTMIHWAAGWGKAFAEIQRTPRGLYALYPIHPSRVVVQYLSRDRTNYKVYNDDGTVTNIPQERMFYLPGMSIDGRTGYSVLKLMANTLTLANTTQNYAKTFFDNFARPAGVLETSQVLNKEARENLAKSWHAMYSGPANAGKTAVLEAGIQYKGISMPMTDMQFLELRRFQKEEIAGWFRMPLYKLQDVSRAQGWSTLDAQETDYVNSCLMPWILRVEQEIRRQLMADEYDEAIYPHIEVKGLLRGDVKTRTDFCARAVSLGMMTPNEWRSYEDMDPSEEAAADRLYIQGAMVPLEKAGTQPQKPVSDNQGAGTSDGKQGDGGSTPQEQSDGQSS